ncbi:hypothetical protein [Novosphingobium sp. P6W]|uniref:hypothetical protein n=1 Tax=Novosphingobium sp. P6W TaxID=1609758 RepID=UPI0013B427B2|nr:hypothetical protein [Novosphingobium sp. P6W]
MSLVRFYRRADGTQQSGKPAASEGIFSVWVMVGSKTEHCSVAAYANANGRPVVAGKWKRPKRGRLAA